MSPFDSTDLTEVLTQGPFPVQLLRSPDTAEHEPDYRVVAEFKNREELDIYLAESPRQSVE
jgi:hypothetical protein